MRMRRGSYIPRILRSMLVAFFLVSALTSLVCVVLLPGPHSADWVFERVAQRNIVVGVLYFDSYAKIHLTYWVEPVGTGTRHRGTYTADRFSISHTPPHPEGGVHYGTVEVSFSLWAVFSVSAICSALLVVRALRQRLWSARQRAGLCTKCGYDLRSSSERCPECGRPFTRETQQADAAV